MKLIGEYRLIRWLRPSVQRLDGLLGRQLGIPRFDGRLFSRIPGLFIGDYITIALPGERLLFWIGCLPLIGWRLGAFFNFAGEAPALRGGGSSGGLVNFSTVEAGGRTWTIMTLSKDKHPSAAALGDKVVVGGQTLSFDGTKIIMAR